ncbi:hypothetical protein ACOME3_004110 [Neoechinorhynchus agilis]
MTNEAILKRARWVGLTFLHPYMLSSLIIAFLLANRKEYSQEHLSVEVNTADEYVFQWFCLPLTIIIVLSSLKTGLLKKNWKFNLIEMVGICAVQFLTTIVGAIVIYFMHGTELSIMLVVMAIPIAVNRLLIEFLDHKIHKAKNET